MTREAKSRLNSVIEGYRKSLVYYAKACDWDAFKQKAGNLFDYLESIELSELERKFFRIFRTILFVLIVVAAFLLKLHAGIFPSLAHYKDEIALTALVISCYEIYFYLDYRRYVMGKSSWYKLRRERFVRNIENDFKSFVTYPND